jgi:ubiquinone/menaquinone biosynthesis C-methylase UbiE
MLYNPLDNPKVCNFIQRLFQGQKPHTELAESLRGFRNLKCLEIGAGTGLASPQGVSRLTVTDISAAYLKKIPVSAERVACSATRLPFVQQSFDVIFSLGLFHHLDDKEFVKAPQEVRRVMKDDGVFINIDNIWPTSKLRIPALLVRLMDRGKNVRTERKQKQIISSVFPHVK